MTALGVTATTYETTVSKGPDDVVGLSYDRLPIGEGVARKIDREMDANEKGDEAATTQRASDGASSDRVSNSAGGKSQSNDADPGSADSKASIGADSSSGSESSSSSDRSDGQRRRTEVPTEPPLWDRLLDLLQRLFALLVPLTGLGLLLGLAYRYRRRLFELDPASEERSGTDQRAGTRATDWWTAASPKSDVERAWFAMASALDLDRPWARTPAEFRATAIEAGFDQEAVDALTRVFRETRYADSQPSEAQRRLARRSLDRLDLRGDGP